MDGTDGRHRQNAASDVGSLALGARYGPAVAPDPAAQHAGASADPMTAPPLRWGVLGPGGIAATFTVAAARHTRSRVVAVGSRSLQRARAFAQEHGVPTAHGSYEQLVADPRVEAVYVATPISEHRDHALLAIAAGRHVLVEKAFTRDAAEAREVFAAGAAAGVFVMEAMWTRFLPHVLALRALVASGAIGDVVSVTADHGQAFTDGSPRRLFAPELAGGALLDLGVYPVSLAHALLGAPRTVTAVGELTSTGVDASVGLLLTHGGGAHGAPAALSTLHTTLRARTATTASVAGTRGRIDVAPPFYAPTSITLTRDDGSATTQDHRVDAGFQHQIAEVAGAVAAERTTSAVMTPGDTVEVMEVLDAARAQVGVVFPGR